jgi:hypothetical protein
MRLRANACRSLLAATMLVAVSGAGPDASSIANLTGVLKKSIFGTSLDALVNMTRDKVFDPLFGASSSAGERAGERSPKPAPFDAACFNTTAYNATGPSFPWSDDAELPEHEVDDNHCILDWGELQYDYLDGTDLTSEV